MLAPLRWLGNHATLVLPVCLISGMFIGPWFAVLDQWLVELITILFAISLLDVDTIHIRAELRHAAWLPVGIAVLLIGIPLLAHLAAKALQVDPIVHAGLVLMLCSPPISIVGNIARLAGTVAIPGLVIMATLSLAALATVPWTANLLLLGSEIDVISMTIRLAYIVLGGASIATIARLLIKPATRKKITKELDGLATLMLALFLFAVLAEGSRQILAEPARALATLVVSASVMAILFALTVGILTLAKVVPGRTITWGLCSCFRNLALVLAALPLAQAEPLFLYLVIVQVPIYLSPLIAKLVYKFLSHRQASAPQ